MNPYFITVIGGAAIGGLGSWIYGLYKGEDFNTKRFVICAASGATIAVSARWLFKYLSVKDATNVINTAKAANPTEFMRMSDLAKELGVSSRAVGAKLRELGLFENPLYGQTFDFNHKSKFLNTGWEISLEAAKLVKTAFK
ncbi:MAG: hypothetical protein HAW67_05060 [Endozoicomonadaceae bacterium]|nr:hypothetical protein [Endozoicomonadaceae bacterium]